METKYHINKKGQKAICGATQRKCRYSTHFMAQAPTGKQATQAAEKQIQQDMDKLNPPAPIDLPSPKLKHPDAGLIYWDNETTSYLDYKTGERVDVAVTYSYEAYENEEGVEDYDEYGRNRVYKGLGIDNVNPKQVLADTFNCKQEDIPDSMVDDLKLADMATPDAYEVSGEWGYYGQELSYSAPEGLQSFAEAQYWKLPNAEDKNGVLRYLRGKGFATEGLSPVEALKAHIASENNGKVPASIANATQIKVLDKMRISNVQTAPTKLARATGAVPETKLDGTKAIIGVLAQDPSTREYKLIDGYRRMKYHQENPAAKRTGSFFVLV